MYTFSKVSEKHGHVKLVTLYQHLVCLESWSKKDESHNPRQGTDKLILSVQKRKEVQYDTIRSKQFENKHFLWAYGYNW